jgi:hypothetical protein
LQVRILRTTSTHGISREAERREPTLGFLDVSSALNAVESGLAPAAGLQFVICEDI